MEPNFEVIAKLTGLIPLIMGIIIADRKMSNITETKPRNPFEYVLILGAIVLLAFIFARWLIILRNMI